MSKDKGIFEPKEGFASDKPTSNPFEFSERKDSNPFASGPPQKSPFSSTDGPPPPPPAASGGGFASSPFGESDRFDEPADKPSFTVVDEQESNRPSAGPPSLGGSGGFGEESTASPAAAEPAAVEPVRPAVSSTPPANPAGEEDPFGEGLGSIRQLELRAIFGVDRELSEGEILERARNLKGIRELARVPAADVPALDSIKRLLGGLNFAGGAVKLTCGGAPVEFIREGSAVLAVQNDGSFAPGVRETLLIVARELSRM